MFRRTLLVLILFTALGCNNNRTERRSLSEVCDPEADVASFELSEREEDRFDLVPGGLPTGSTYRTSGFTITKVEGDIITSYAPSRLFTDEVDVETLCAFGFPPDESSSGTFVFSVPILNTEQEFNDYTFSISYDTDRPNGDLPVIVSDGAPTLTPLTGVDILGELIALGYEVNLYTASEGGNRNVIFIAHARDLSQGLTLRVRIETIQE